LPDTTLLVVTHDREVARQCDRTVTLDEGRIISPQGVSVSFA
jgi:predicted ABC-type transport system involved in lysophospholipase L1 biosynthesis ATPase subunit